MKEEENIQNNIDNFEQATDKAQTDVQQHSNGDVNKTARKLGTHVGKTWTFIGIDVSSIFIISATL